MRSTPKRFKQLARPWRRQPGPSLTRRAAWAHSTAPVATSVCADAPWTAPQVQMGTGVVPTTLEHRLSLAPASRISKERCRGLKAAHPRDIFPGTSSPPQCALIVTADVASRACVPTVLVTTTRNRPNPLPRKSHQTGHYRIYPGLNFHFAAVGVPLPHGGGYPSSQRRLWSRITVKWYCQLA